MKNYVYKTVVGLAAAVVLSTGVVYASTSPVYKIGDQFKEPLKGLTGSNYVMMLEKGDVNGDKIEDEIIVVGQTETIEDIYHSKVNILIRDGKTENYKMAKAGGGYDGKLFVGDFDGDKIDDVAISLNTGGSGGMVENTIVSFINENPKYLLNEESNKIFTVEGKYVDGFKAEIFIKELNKTIIINLETKKTDYIENKIYDEKGKILTTVEPWVDGIKNLNALDYNGDETLELIAMTSLSGTSHADKIADIDFVMQYLDGKWEVKQMKKTEKVFEQEFQTIEAK